MSKEKILSAALGVFAEQGYHGGSMAQIAERAGVAKSLAYHHFDSKEEILVELARERLESYLPVRRVLESEMPAAERLKQLIDLALGELKRNPQGMRFWTSLYLTPEGPRAIRKAQAQYPSEFACPNELEKKLFADLGSERPEVDATLFRSILQGICLEAILCGGKYPLEEVKDALIQRFLP